MSNSDSQGFRKANILLRENRYAEALALFQYLYRAQPDFKYYREGIDTCLRKLGQSSKKGNDIKNEHRNEGILVEVQHPGTATTSDSLTRFVVITPVLNGAEYLNETIQSVLSQAGDYFIDYIIKDAGSRDGTIELVNTWCERLETGNYPMRCKGMRITFISSPDNGMYDAVAIGFESKSIKDDDILTYINADDILSPEAFNTTAKVFHYLPEVSWLISQPKVINEVGMVLSSPTFPVAYNQQDVAEGLHDGRWLGFIQQEGTFWRGNLYNKVNGLNRSLKLAGDYDLWRRFSLHTEPLALNKSLGAFRKRPGQLSSVLDKYYQEVKIILSHPQQHLISGISEATPNRVINTMYFNKTGIPFKGAFSQRPGAVCFLDETSHSIEVAYIKRSWYNY